MNHFLTDHENLEFVFFIGFFHDLGRIAAQRSRFGSAGDGLLREFWFFRDKFIRGLKAEVGDLGFGDIEHIADRLFALGMIGNSPRHHPPLHLFNDRGLHFTLRTAFVKGHGSIDSALIGFEHGVKGEMDFRKSNFILFR